MNKVGICPGCRDLSLHSRFGKANLPVSVVDVALSLHPQSATQERESPAPTPVLPKLKDGFAGSCAPHWKPRRMAWMLPDLTASARALYGCNPGRAYRWHKWSGQDQRLSAAEIHCARCGQ